MDIQAIELTDWNNGNLEKDKNNIDTKAIKEIMEKAKLYKNDIRNLMVYKEDGKYYTKGYIGIVRLKDENNNQLKDDTGKECVLKVLPRFNIEPIEALAYVAEKDDEFNQYEASLNSSKDKANGKERWLYKFFEDEAPIKINKDEHGDAMLLLAINFISQLNTICKKHLMPTITTVDNNLTGKVKGKIMFTQHIKYNVLKGRADRVYCRHQEISYDNIENCILKEALYKAEKILKTFRGQGISNNKIIYCKNIFEIVPRRKIKQSDFLAIKVKGLYSYYKPALQTAKLLLKNISLNYNSEHDIGNYYIIPFAINMETIFEFYCRTIIKEVIKEQKEKNIRGLNKFELEKYISNDVNTENRHKILKKGNCNYVKENFIIPDIVLKKDNEIIVFDCKYKDSTRSEKSRGDIHQLLSYCLLKNSKKVGFIFPIAPKENSNLIISDDINIFGNDIRKYYEIALFKAKKNDKNNDEKIIHENAKKNIANLLNELIGIKGEKDDETSS